jgi:hypothetical protein
MGKYDDLFEPDTAGQVKGKYADLFDTEPVPSSMAEEYAPSFQEPLSQKFLGAIEPELPLPQEQEAEPPFLERPPEENVPVVARESPYVSDLYET